MHLAAQASVAGSVKDPVADASVNLIGLLNVLECAAGTGARKVVYAGSGGTLYGEPKVLPVKEAHRNRGRPISPYGISKAVGIQNQWQRAVSCELSNERRSLLIARESWSEHNHIFSGQQLVHPFFCCQGYRAFRSLFQAFGHQLRRKAGNGRLH